MERRTLVAGEQGVPGPCEELSICFGKFRSVRCPREFLGTVALRWARPQPGFQALVARAHLRQGPAASVRAAQKGSAQPCLLV